VARATPIGGGRGGTLDILFQHQPSSTSRRRSLQQIAAPSEPRAKFPAEQGKITEKVEATVSNYDKRSFESFL
jgi:hypothetical protein